MSQANPDIKTNKYEYDEVNRLTIVRLTIVKVNGGNVLVNK